MTTCGQRRLLWAFAFLLIGLFAWRDLAGAGVALAVMNAGRLSGGDNERYEKILAFALNLEGVRNRDLLFAAAPDSGAVETVALRAYLLGNLGSAAWGRGDVATALGYQQQAIQADPNRAELHFNLGVMLAERGDLVEAQAAFREAVLLAPDWYDAYLHLGALALEQQDFELAESAARRALAINPKSLQAAQVLAGAVLQQDVSQEVFAEIAALQERFPRDPMLRLYRANYLRSLGQRQESTDALLDLLRTTRDATLRDRLKAELALNAASR